MTALLILTFFTGRFSNSIERFSERDLAYYEAQKWVVENTLLDSTFFLYVDGLTYTGWRNFTNRPALSLKPDPGPYGYYESDYQFEQTFQRRSKYFGSQKILSPNIEFLVSEGKRFGIDYVVANSEFNTQNLTTVFRNKDFVILKLT